MAQLQDVLQNDSVKKTIRGMLQRIVANEDEARITGDWEQTEIVLKRTFREIVARQAGGDLVGCTADDFVRRVAVEYLTHLQSISLRMRRQALDPGCDHVLDARAQVFNGVDFEACHCQLLGKRFGRIRIIDPFA